MGGAARCAQGRPASPRGAGYAPSWAWGGACPAPFDRGRVSCRLAAPPFPHPQSEGARAGGAARGAASTRHAPRARAPHARGGVSYGADGSGSAPCVRACAAARRRWAHLAIEPRASSRSDALLLRLLVLALLVQPLAGRLALARRVRLVQLLRPPGDLRRVGEARVRRPAVHVARRRRPRRLAKPAAVIGLAEARLATDGGA
eukprot:4782611-Prymnesium_polylepis.1